MPFDRVYKSGKKCSKCNRERARNYYRNKPKKVTSRIKYQGKYAQNKTIIKAYKLSFSGCVSCHIGINETNTHMFALDHREPTLKSFTLSQCGSILPSLVVEECQKCDLMCHNCHHLKTRAEGDHLTRRDADITQPEYLPLLLLIEESYENL